MFAGALNRFHSEFNSTTETPTNLKGELLWNCEIPRKS